MRRERNLLFGCLLVMFACKGGAGPTAGTSARTDQHVVTAPAVQPLQKSKDLAPGKYIITDRATLRLTPSNEEIVQDPFKPGEKSNNWVGTIPRAIEATVNNAQDGWCSVKLEKNGGAEGWVDCGFLISLADVRKVTVLEDTNTLDPKSFAVRDQTIEPGTLLFAVETQGDLTRVNTAKQEFAWVRNASLTDDPSEVKVAALISRARRSLVEDDPENFRHLLDTARMNQKDAKLLPVLERSIPLGHANKGVPCESTLERSN